MRRARLRTRVRVLLVGMTLTGLAAASGGITYGAFSQGVSNPSNIVSTGTVALADNDGGTALLSLTSARPGDSDSGCIQVTSTGSLPAEVRHYATLSGTLGPYLQLKVTRGTDPSPSADCSGFTPDGCDYGGNGAGVIYSGTVSAFPTTWAAGVVDPGTCPGAPETWTQSEAHSYRYDVSFAGTNPAAEGTSADLTLRWEAQNQ